VHVPGGGESLEPSQVKVEDDQLQVARRLLLRSSLVMLPRLFSSHCIRSYVQ
jgi:hypothetical protein